MIRVLIADDHAVVREGLKRIVADTADMTVAGEAATGHEVLAFTRTQDCDLMVRVIAEPPPEGMVGMTTYRAEPLAACE